MSDELEQYCELARNLAFNVGKKLREVTFGKEELDITLKDSVDLVTKWDLWSEKTIRSGIKEYFPDHKILGEEGSGFDYSDLQHGTCWVIDPIDGTTNFSNRIPHYAISIGILIDGIPTVGIVYDPCKDEMFHAISKKGAYLNDSLIHTSTKNKLIESVVATGFAYDRVKTWHKEVDRFSRVLLGCRDIRRWGGAALDICYVACGRFDCYFEGEIKLWDIAAGHVILTEAGGSSQNYQGTLGGKFLFSNGSYCCGSGNSFKELFSTLQDKGV